MSAPRPSTDNAASRTRRRRTLALGGVFLVVLVGLGIEPSYREDWLLENALVFVALPLLVVTYRRLPLSQVSYVSLFVFLCLHEVGAHYTYSRVPYEAWCERWFGGGLNAALGWERNHYDRLVHFLYGLLIAYPVREVFLRVAAARGFWGYLFPVLVVTSSSMLFELLEWAAALVFAGDLGEAYMGSQGDAFDSHKDVALATLGAVIATGAVAVTNAWLDRDFAREWAESLDVKHPEPLGEVELQRLFDQDD